MLCSASEAVVTAVESSLVLFEEVDVVFDDDVGFYAALRKLARHFKFRLRGGVDWGENPLILYTPNVE